MLQVSITLLFAVTAFASLAVVTHSLRRAWLAAGVLRRALAECDDIVRCEVRVVELRRLPAPVLRVSAAGSWRRTAPAPYALRAAA